MKAAIVVIVSLSAAVTLANPPWSANVRACDVGDTINEGESCIAADGNYVYCICNCNERSRYPVIPYGRSTDGGATWTSTWWNDPSVGVSWHSDPVLLVDDTGYVHMLVQFSTTVERHYLSTDHGVTWCESTNVSEFLPGGTCDKPWGCIYGNDIYYAWQQWGASQEGIIFAKSTDGGRTWTRTEADPTRTGITGICTSPSGIIYLMNRYWSGGSVHCTRSTDRGETWAPWVTVATGCTYTSGYGDRAPLPSIAAPTDSIVFITWVDDRYGNWDILYSRSTNAGRTWSPVAQLADSTAGGQCKGWVTADCYGRLHFIWYHTPSWPTSSNSQWSVRYTHSDDYGATIEPSIRLTDTTFRSPVTFMGEYHVLVTDSNYARVVWTDGRGGDLDLYFAQALLSQIGIEENPFRTTRLPGVSLSVPALTREALPVEFGLRRTGPVIIGVYDALGRSLAHADLGVMPAGLHRHEFSGLPTGRPLFVHLRADETVTARSLVLRR